MWHPPVVPEWIADAADLTIVFLSWYWPLLVVIALLLSVRWPDGLSVFDPLRAAAERLAQRPAASALVIFGLAMFWMTLPAMRHGAPLPWMHDDYANLLGGEMFASGRLSAPPHPLWQHFETMHELMLPRYASKYPPGQALVLAGGIRLFGCAIAGEWIVTALACVAIAWAVGAWLTPLTGLLAGFAAAVHPTIFEWGSSYRGAGLAALAGAIVLGCTRRMMDERRLPLVAITTLAAMLLVITRPFEGMLLIIACGAVLIVTRGIRELLPALPLALVIVALGAAGHAAYNKAVSGNAFEMPYATYKQQYDPMPIFVWQKPAEVPPHRNEELATTYRVYMSQYRRQSTLRGYAGEVRKKLDVIRFAVFGRPATSLLERLWPLFLVVLLPLAQAARRTEGRRLLVMAAICLSAPFIITGWLLTLYLAPAAAVGAALGMLLFEELRHSPRGAQFAFAAALLFTVNAAVSLVNATRVPQRGTEFERRQIARTLETHGGKHLVLVPPDVFGVTYNTPHIDGQQVIWARDLGDNRRLLEYYKDRQVWALAKENGRLAVSRF